MNFKMNTNKEWLLKKAEQEDNAILSVGGLVNRLAREDGTPAAESMQKVAFANDSSNSSTEECD